MGNLIWTNHVLGRIAERRINKEWVAKTYQSPDSRSGNQYQKKFADFTVYAIIKKNKKREPVVLSAWVNPPLAGTAEARKREKYLEYRENYRRASFWGKFWLDIKRALTSLL